MHINLVTGITGFIGTQLALALRNAGEAVIGIDNNNPYYDIKLKLHRQSILTAAGVQVFNVDIQDPKLVELFQQFKFTRVFHLGGMAGVRYSVERPELYYQTNVLGTLNILNCVRDFHVKQFVFASTSSAYAGLTGPFSEEMSVSKPSSPYSASKIAAEQLIYNYHYLYKIPANIVRYFTVYGPMGRPDMSVLKFIHNVAQGKSIPVYGTGEQVRDFTYVSDIVSGTIRAAELQSYDIINLGNCNPHPLSTLINLIGDGLGKPVKIDQFPMQASDMQITWANIDKARKLLHWQPSISLATGVELTIKEYLANKEFYTTIKI